MAFSENNIERLLEQAEAAGVFNKAVAGFILPDGSARIIPFNTPEDTVFDIASLTKVCPTSTLALSYILEGKLSVDAKVIDYIPELQTNYREDVRIFHLLYARSRPKESSTRCSRTSSKRRQEPISTTGTPPACSSESSCSALRAKTCNSRDASAFLNRSA